MTRRTSGLYAGSRGVHTWSSCGARPRSSRRRLRPSAASVIIGVIDERAAWSEALARKEAHDTRVAFARTASDAIAAAGQALAFLAPDDKVRGLALAAQMGGSLATGTCDLLDRANAYAAAALLRQVVEVEYLFWTVAEDPEDAARWVCASRAELERRFRPWQMRKRSEGRFRVAEYQAHCDHGGHPNPAGWSLVAADPPYDPVRLMWVDLGQHTARAWKLLVAACVAVDRANAVRRDAPAVSAAYARWLDADLLARRSPLTEPTG
jgi:hypothetical protein